MCTQDNKSAFTQHYQNKFPYRNIPLTGTEYFSAVHILSQYTPQVYIQMRWMSLMYFGHQRNFKNHLTSPPLQVCRHPGGVFVTLKTATVTSLGPERA